MNPPQKSQALFKHLDQLLTPTLNTSLESFNDWKAKLQLSDNQDISHSQNFEKDEVLLSIRFRDKEDLEKSLPAIRRISSRRAD
jgi:hypothetical protein